MFLVVVFSFSGDAGGDVQVSSSFNNKLQEKKWKAEIFSWTAAFLWEKLRTSFQSERRKWAVLRRTWLTEPYSLSSNQRANQVCAVLTLPFSPCCCWKADGPIHFPSFRAAVTNIQPQTSAWFTERTTASCHVFCLLILYNSVLKKKILRLKWKCSKIPKVLMCLVVKMFCSFVSITFRFHNMATCQATRPRCVRGLLLWANSERRAG